VHTVRSSVDATLYGTTTHVRSSCHPRSLPSEELVHLLSRVDPRSFHRPPAAPAVTAASAARADADARPTSYRVGAVGSAHGRRRRRALDIDLARGRRWRWRVRGANGDLEV